MVWPYGFDSWFWNRFRASGSNSTQEETCLRFKIAFLCHVAGISAAFADPPVTRESLAEQERRIEAQWKTARAFTQSLQQSWSQTANRPSPSELKASFETQAAFIRSVDRYSMDRLRYTVDKTLEVIEEVKKDIADAKVQAAPKDRAFIDQTLDQIETDAKTFIHRMSSDPERPERPLNIKGNKGFRDFFENTEKLLQKLESLQSERTKIWIDRLIKGISKIVLYVKAAWAAMHGALQLPTFRNELFLSPDRPPEAKTRTTQIWDRFFRQIADGAGLKFELKGEENLAPVKKPKTVTFVVPHHSSEIIDHLAVANLNLDHYVIFGAVDRWPSFLKPYKDQLAQNQDIIAVGRGQAIDSAFKKITEREIQNVVIYPEGVVPLAGETRPISPRFFKDMIGKLLDTGYEVRFLPVSHGDRPELIRTNMLESATEARRIPLTVHTPIEPEMTRFLLQEDPSGALLETLIRSSWLEGQMHNQDYILGMFRTETFERAIASRWAKISSWVTRGSCLEKAILKMQTPIVRPQGAVPSS